MEQINKATHEALNSALKSSAKLVGKGKSCSNDLLCCPFCGGEPRTGEASFVTEHNSWLPEFVECPKCKIGFYQTDGAIKRWNTRAI